MVALINVGSVGTPANGHNDAPANIALNIFYTAGASPLTEVGTIGPVHVGRFAIPPGEVGSHDPLSGNAVTFMGLSGPVIDVIDGFSISWTHNGNTETRTLGPEAFVDLTAGATVSDLATVINTLGSPLAASRDFNGNLQVVATQFPSFLVAASLTSSTGLPHENTTVDITGVTDAEAGAVDSFVMKTNGVPLDTSSIDFATIGNRAELAAALNLLPGIAVTESSDNGGTLTITLESDGPHTFSDISLADLTPNPAKASFGMVSGEALNVLVAAAESFALNLNGTPLDFSGLDFSTIETATELAAALDALDGISAQLSDAFITISSDVTGPGNAFSDLALIDNQGSPAAPATVYISQIDGVAQTARGFTLSLDGVPVDTSAVDFAAVTDGVSLAAELDKIDGIHVVYTFWDAGRLEITSDTVGPATFSNVTLTRPNSVVGFDFVDDVLTGFTDGTLIIGLSGNDQLTGQDADDRLEGGEGNDTLVGNGGPDELIGGIGNDVLFGGAGDTLDGGAGNDLVVIDSLPVSIAGGDGEDTLRLMISMAAPQVGDIERIEVGASAITAGFSAWTGAAHVWITAGGGATVIGSAFDDIVTGGAGNDSFTGGDGTDTAVFTCARVHYRVELLGNGDIRLLDLRVGLPDGMDTVRQVERFVFADGTFDATTVLNDPPTGIVTIDGSATEDQTLTADTTALADQDGIGATHYQWQRESDGGVVNVGSDQATYTLGDADVGATIRVVVSYIDLNGSPEQLVSGSTGTVANINDAPVITAHGGGSSADITIPENTAVAATLTAADVDGPALGYSITGGADAALFRIDPATGVLSFVAAPDFEHPADSDHDNSYVVTLRASDGGLFDEQTLTVTVTDTSEAPPIEVLTGTPGDDSFAAPPGSAQIAGLAGHDTITFGFALTDAAISFVGGTVIVDFGASHTVLTGFERFVFTDGAVDNDDGHWLIDDLFYYSRNHDVWAAHVDAEAHYAAFGRHEGRDPNALFDAAGYLAAYQDVAAAQVNPLDHYDTFGWREGRDPSVGFDSSSYLAAYPDVAAAQVDPLTHYLVFGMHEGRSPFADGVWG